MTFRIGDMVQIVSGQTFVVDNAGLNCFGPVDVGKIGTITQCIDLCGGVYMVNLADGEKLLCSPAVLRLIPGDSEGRKLVEWNWRELLPPKRTRVEELRAETRAAHKRERGDVRFSARAGGAMMKRRQKITPEQTAKVEEWHRARVKLGTAKIIAHKVGVSEAQVKQAVMRMKREVCDA